MHTSHGLGSINSEHLFLTVLEAGKSKIKVPAADSVPGEGLLPGSQVTLFSQRLHLMEGGEDSSDSLLLFFYLLIRERGGGEKREGERNVSLLFPLFKHLLAASCVCPDCRQNSQPWCMG